MKIAFALGGGGAKGLAHIGVLQELTAAGIVADLVVGTSAGALVGATYIANALEELVREVENIKLTDIPLLLSPSMSLSGLFSGKSALELLGEIIPYPTVETLPKPFAAVATDLLRDEVAVLNSGDLRSALRASISIPVLFTPVQRDDLILVDGGVKTPLPIETARAMGGDFVLAVDLFSQHPLPRSLRAEQALEVRQPSLTLWPKGLTSALQHLRTLLSKTDSSVHTNMIEIVELTLSSTQRTLTEAALQNSPPDFLIAPEVSQVGLLDFHRAGPIIELGRHAAQTALPQLLTQLDSWEESRSIAPNPT